MAENKQVVEMAKCCPYYHKGECCADATDISKCDLMCEMFGVFANLEVAGYRKQEWVSVDGYERYSVNEYGIVKNNETGMVLTPIKNKAGYLTVCLYNGAKKTVRIHRLVAQAFIPNPENKPFINHKNGIKTDNRACNLEWVTSAENNLHKCRVLGKKSTNEPNPKIAVRCVETGETFESMSDASKKYKTQPIHISECCRGKRKTAGGLHWMPLPDAPKGE